MITFLKSPFPNAVTLGVRASVHEFWGDTIQSRTTDGKGNLGKKVVGPPVKHEQPDSDLWKTGMERKPGMARERP